MDRAALLDAIQTERARFESLIAPLSEKQLCSPTLDGQWSVKDIMAHIAVWEQICTSWLEEFACGMTPQPSERNDFGINERIYRENRERPLAEVQELFSQAHQQFLRQVDQLVQTISEEDVSAPDRFAWTDSWPGHSLLAVIADNSYEHYYDHGEQIRRWLETSQ